MLVNLSKDEMKTIIFYLIGDTDPKAVNIVDKLQPILDACECKEQNDTYNKINSQKNDKEIRTGITQGSISKS